MNIKRIIQWIPGKFVSLFYLSGLIDEESVKLISWGKLTHYHDANRKEFLDYFRKIKRTTEFAYLDEIEAYFIHMSVTRTSKIHGDIAEVGVYKGGTADLICKVRGNKSLYLFDTFEGIPSVESIDTSNYQGEFSSSYEDVKKHFENEPRVFIYKGIFPDSAAPVDNNRFSFVHLDVDTYRSTMDCLHFFYPRMNQSGIILSHDYLTGPGVKMAFDEFFSNKPEIVLETGGTQCIIVKV